MVSIVVCYPIVVAIVPYKFADIYLGEITRAFLGQFIWKQLIFTTRQSLHTLGASLKDIVSTKQYTEHEFTKRNTYTRSRYIHFSSSVSISSRTLPWWKLQHVRARYNHMETRFKWMVVDPAEWDHVNSPFNTVYGRLAPIQFLFSCRSYYAISHACLMIQFTVISFVRGGSNV
jgi:hypothetical protein